MRNYTHLDQEKRYQISALLKAGYQRNVIAAEIGVHKSTITREIKRNQGQRGYRPKQANKFAIERCKGSDNATRINASQWRLVKSCLQEKLSPEQISGRLKLSGKLHISHESIYRYVYRDKNEGGNLVQYLRGKKQYRKRYASGHERRGALKNRTSIDDRPVIVEAKVRIGDWEGDTVIGKNHQGAIVTLVDRRSRYTLAAPLPSKHADGVTQAIKTLLEPHKERCHTITFDNGKEFAEHEVIAAYLDASIYFAHPYHSWERGVNENTNGLLRQYFPKGTDLRKVSVDEVSYAMHQLNHRPRKCLGYRTPHEVFYGLPSIWNNEDVSVALRC
jgi:IS30 family transposase